MFRLNDFTLTALFLLYLSVVLFCGFVYGRHKGLSHSRAEAILDGETSAKFKLIEISSKLWFLLCTFVFPWYLCVVWLFYSMHHNDFHYINDYNPWILPVIVIYVMHSLVILASYRYYSFHSTFSKISTRATIVFAVCLTVCVLFIVEQNIDNDPQRFSSDGFYGHHIRYCFDLDVHRNPIILSILLILYGSVTHHLFVTLRAITAKCCDHEYIEKTVEFYAKSKRMRVRKMRRERARRDRKKGRRRKASYNPDDGTVYEYNSSTLDDYDLELSESVGIMRKQERNYLRNPSDSHPRAKRTAAAHRQDDLELRMEHVISAEVESKNPHPLSVYV